VNYDFAINSISCSFCFYFGANRRENNGLTLDTLWIAAFQNRRTKAAAWQWRSSHIVRGSRWNSAHSKKNSR